MLVSLVRVNRHEAALTTDKTAKASSSPNSLIKLRDRTRRPTMVIEKHIRITTTAMIVGTLVSESMERDSKKDIMLNCVRSWRSLERTQRRTAIVY